MPEFSPEAETARGGLDRYLGPTAESASTIPAALTPGNEDGTDTGADMTTPDCRPTASGQVDPLCELAEAVRVADSEKHPAHHTPGKA